MKPLQNVRIAVTRAVQQAEELAVPLRALGATVRVTPLIRIVPAEDLALPDLTQFDWIVFTSANGVAEFVARAHDALDGLRAKIACVGPATAAAAARHGLVTDAMPHEFMSDALADALRAHGDLHDKQILIARAGGARQELPRRLTQAGARVSDLELYRSEIDARGARELKQHISNDDVDVVTFTSGSAVRYFAREIGDPGKAIVAVIGPMTAEAAREHGLEVRIAANPHTTEGLAAAISNYFGG